MFVSREGNFVPSPDKHWAEQFSAARAFEHFADVSDGKTLHQKL
jgi:hypothetical protein